MPLHRGCSTRRHSHNLVRALWYDWEAYLRFLANLGVPFINNLAEQAVGMVKLQMKILGASAPRGRSRVLRSACVRGLPGTGHTVAAYNQTPSRQAARKRYLNSYA